MRPGMMTLPSRRRTTAPGGTVVPAGSTDLILPASTTRTPPSMSSPETVMILAPTKAMGVSWAATWAPTLAKASASRQRKTQPPRGGGRKVRLVHAFGANDCFPLTPALSLRERENGGAASGEMDRPPRADG